MTTAEKQWVAKVVPKMLPFERLMEMVFDAMTDQDRADFLAVFRLGNPALAHSFIAAAAKRRHLNAIFTMNFDCHLETALSNNKVKLGTDVVVLHDITSALASTREGHRGRNAGDEFMRDADRGNQR